jgi:hypothetical protein
MTTDSKTLGTMTADIPLSLEQISQIHFLSIRRVINKDRGPGNNALTGNPDVRYIQGLALLRCANSSSYARVGSFDLVAISLTILRLLGSTMLPLKKLR